jgi:hypothetical protein
MLRQNHIFPPLPEIGHPEAYYAKLAHDAEKRGDQFAREAAKVGQYVTLGTDPHLEWPAKLRYFQHALRRHCVPPPIPDEDVWSFYRGLADLVRTYAGSEALKLASAEDDLYAVRLSAGTTRGAIESDAESFFEKLMGLGDQRPDHFKDEDWMTLRILRDQWI